MHVAGVVCGDVIYWMPLAQKETLGGQYYP